MPGKKEKDSAEVTANNAQRDKDDSSGSSSVGSLDVAACCICRCSLDYSDRAAFFERDRHEDYGTDEVSYASYVFRPNDPYLPKHWYNPHNALVYCDSCERLYHQQCHMIPLLTGIPRGKWLCAVCSENDAKKTKSKKSGKTLEELAHIFPSQFPSTVSNNEWQPPTAEMGEFQWFTQASPYLARQVQLLLEQQIPKRLRSTIQNYHTVQERFETILQDGQKQRRHSVTTSGTAAHRRNHYPQAIVDTLVQVTMLQSKIQSLVQGIQHMQQHEYRKGWQQVCDWSRQQRQNKSKTLNRQDEPPSDFVARVLFPFGIPMHATFFPPVTPEATQRDDGSFSLDQLTCSVCRSSDADDENDMVLCDGQGCFRAFHVNCVSPSIPLNEDEEMDWFCPWCCAKEETLRLVQEEVLGEEWVERKMRAGNMTGGEPDDTSSLESWTDAQQVFPDSIWDYDTALALQKGIRDVHTYRLWNQYVLNDGEHESDDNADDDDEEDDVFDLEQFHVERQRKRSDDKPDDNNTNPSSTSTLHSSQASLVDMSSVELEIHPTELRALASERAQGDSDSSTGSSSAQNDHRRSRRIRQQRQVSNISNGDEDPGRLNPSNIIPHKRQRKPVDYIKLNNAIFGDVTDTWEHDEDHDDDENGSQSAGGSNSSCEEENSSNDSGSDTERRRDSEGYESIDSSGSQKETSTKGKGKQNGTSQRSASSSRERYGKAQRCRSAGEENGSKHTRVSPAKCSSSKRRRSDASSNITRRAKKKPIATQTNRRTRRSTRS